MKAAIFTILAAGLICTNLAFSVDIIASDPCLAKIQWGYFSGGEVCLVSSSHQDIAWLDTPAQCEINRDVHTVTPALDAMKAEPDFCFGMEQTLNLKEYLQRHPERKDEILQRAKEKRFTWGATYTQPYESLESGEQLIRQTYFGRKWIEKILPGSDERVAYNVDVPGRAMQMPQILKKAGIDYLVISRQTEGVYNWASPDGSRVAVFSPGVYFHPQMSYGNFKCDISETISKVAARLSQWQDYYRRHNLPPVHCIYLCADGLSPVNYSGICKKWNALADEFNKTSPANNKMPAMKHQTALAFMDSVVKPGAKLDTVVGERPNLWLYIHGPAHHWAISAKRDAAVLLPAAEMFATVNSVLSGGFAAYPQQKLSDAWEASIYPDHGWGGKNGDITDQIFREKFEYARSIAWQALSESIKSISAKIKTADIGRPLIVFNDLSWQRDGIVKIAMNNVNSPFVIKDGSGSVMPHQICNNQIIFAAMGVPSIGYKTYYLVDIPGKAETSAVSVGKTASSYENNYFKVSFTQGGLKSILDKQEKRQILKTDKFLAGEIFSMQSVGNGAGEFVKIQMPSMEGFDRGGNHNSQWTLVESGKIRDVFELRYSFVDCNIIEKAIFYKQFKKIDFEVEVKNWAGRYNRELRVAFPLALPNGNIAYEAPMGILKVGKDEMKGSPGGWTAEGSYTQNVPEIHPREVLNFITAYNKNFAITIGGSVAVWDYIDPTTNPVDYPILQPLLLATRKSCHQEGNWYLQKGDHSYYFSLLPHKADWKQGWQRGIESNHSFYAVVNPPKNADADLPAEKSFFSASAKNVVISAIKKCEDDNSVVVRIYEIEGHAAYPVLKVPFKISAAEYTDIIEENGIKLPSNTDSLKIKAGKYAIETFKLHRQGD